MCTQNWFSHGQPYGHPSRSLKSRIIIIHRMAVEALSLVVDDVTPLGLVWYEKVRFRCPLISWNLTAVHLFLSMWRLWVSVNLFKNGMLTICSKELRMCSPWLEKNLGIGWELNKYQKSQLTRMQNVCCEGWNGRFPGAHHSRGKTNFAFLILVRISLRWSLSCWSRSYRRWQTHFKNWKRSSGETETLGHHCRKK